MKISEFARKFGVNINTVRYYINTGLLIPESVNKQYRFNEQNIEDMWLIIKLKQFSFSIGQIHDVLSLIRISNLHTSEDIREYIEILENKKGVLQAELTRLQQSISELDSYTESIRQLDDRQLERPKKTGVPLEFIPYLCCPICDGAFTFKDTSIENSQIIDAELHCTCGYKAHILNGIFVTPGRYISDLDSPDLDRKFYKDLPATWVSLFQKSYNWIYNRMRMEKLDGKIVMENHINCYFFLYTVLGKLNRNALYIISDKYPEMVTLYKELIESQNLGLKILFLADSSFQYPLKKNCIDLYVDYCAINEYSIFNAENSLLDVMHPYMKSGAEILGTYFYFDPNSASQRKLLMEYPGCLKNNYLLSHFYSCIHPSKAKLLDEEENGFVTDKGSKNRNFSFHVEGTKLHLHSYHYRYP